MPPKPKSERTPEDAAAEAQSRAENPITMGDLMIDQASAQTADGLAAALTRHRTVTAALATSVSQRDGLRAIPAKWGDPPADMLAKLPKGGDKNKDNWATCKLCGGWHAKNAVHLDYMGHADVTLALIDTDPLWEWEPAAWEGGAPAITVNAGEASMWIRLTVLGKTLPAVGTCPSTKGDMFKELVGDALRNGALRFGIATKLWSKTDGAASSSPEDAPVTAPVRSSAPVPDRSGGRTAPAASTAPPPTPVTISDAQRGKEEVTLDGTSLERLSTLRRDKSNKSDGQWTAALATIARNVGHLPADLTTMVQNEAIWAAAAIKFELA